jgi:hypothetical protein
MELVDPRTLRWPLQPLLDATGHTPYGIARALGIAQGTIRAAITCGLSDPVADKIAVRLGCHPAMIWPGWCEAALRPLDHDYLDGGWRQAWLYRERAA